MKKVILISVFCLFIVAVIVGLQFALPKFSSEESNPVKPTMSLRLPKTKTLFDGIYSAHVHLSTVGIDSSGWGAFLEGFPKETTLSIDGVRQYLYEELNLKYSGKESDLKEINPFEVIRNGKSTCVGTSVLVLLLAEHLGMPFKAVPLPSHLFLRWESDSLTQNFEPNRKGYAYTDDEYRLKYELKDSTRFDLQSISNEEVLATYLYSIGTAYLSKGLFIDARNWLENAVEKAPGFIEARGNLALTLRKLGYIRRGIEELEKAKALAPNDLKILRYLSRLYFEAGFYKMSYTEIQRIKELEHLNPEDRALEKKLNSKIETGGLLFLK